MLFDPVNNSSTAGCTPRGHGEHRGVLEACVQRAGKTVRGAGGHAQHLKAVPRRKTDVKDAEWIADLLQHGLVRGSFIPARPQRELREVTRYRKSLIRGRASEVNRLQKVLGDANIKLASVATDIMGVSARAMLQAIIGGSEDAEALSRLARGRMRVKRSELERASAGRVTDHHRFILSEQLAHLV